MSLICEHEFHEGDPNDTGYSMTEFDLAAMLALTIRKDHLRDRYEIVTLRAPRVVKYTGTLEAVVAEANRLEGKNHISVQCGPDCPKRLVPHV